MIRKSSVFDYLANVMFVYGIAIISLCLFCVLFGEDAAEVSSMFRLGSAGISIDTLMQFLLFAVILSGLRWLFFTDRIIRNLSIAFRTIWMFVCIIVLMGVFAAVFQWFPVDMAMPWVMFFVCFFIYASVSVGVSVLKEKSDNKKMQEALERLKEEEC